MEIAAEIIAWPVAQAIGWALVHFVWQGALLAVLLAGLLALPFFRAPRVRYALCLAVLVTMMAAPIFTGWTVVMQASGDASFAPAGAVEPDGTLKAGGTLPTPQPTAATGEITAAPPAVQRAYAPSAPDRRERLAAILRWAPYRAAIAPYVPWCVFVWLAGVLAMASRNLASWVLVQRLRTRGVAAVPESVQQALDQLRARVGVRSVVFCLESSRVAVPATIGWLKPLVLLPASSLIGLDPAQLEAILAHELAHIHRHDYLVNLFQTVAETVLFYHPAVWWVSNRMRLERELCCDDLAVRVCGDRAVYVEALAKVAVMRQTPALAVAASGSSLMVRIRRLAQPEAARPSRPANALLSLGIALAACATLFGPNLPRLFAQTNSEPPGPRAITFPEWSMGQVMIRPWGSDLDERWEAHQPAMGTVNVPAGMEVQLVVDNNAVTDLSPLSYLAVEDLQSINFRRTEVQDEQLAYIEGLALRELNFELTEITNDALQYFDDMISLESLSVGRTNVDNEGVGQLGGLTGLRFLDLNLTGVNDEGLSHLENLTQLESLDLWNAQVTDEGLRLIGTLTNLRELGLEGTPITDAGLAHLRNLVKLEGLNLQTTAIGDAGVQYLAALSALRDLSLRNTRVTGAIVDFLLANFHLQGVEMPRQIAPDQLARMDGINRLTPGRNRFTVRVREAASGRPVANAKIEVKWRDTEQMAYTPHYFWTGETGDLTFYHDYTHTADVTVHAEGYVAAVETWEPGQVNEITITLARASHIGGTVVNESGAPVGGVSVHLAVLGERDYVHDVLAPHSEKTDDEGAWDCTHAPADLSEFWIELQHPDYVATEYPAAELSPARLKSRSERLVIVKGIDVSGTVENEAGELIVGATVVELELRRNGLMAATENAARTDETGQFLLTNQKSGPIRLKVNAGGYLPNIEDVAFSAGAEPLRFTLKAGKVLKGIVVDPEDKPIEGVRIEIPLSIGKGANDHASTTWKTVTDGAGRFFWDEAPEEAVSLVFAKPGYQRLQRSLVASDEDIIVVLGQVLSVSGTIVDAETGAPLAGTLRADLIAYRGERTMETSGRPVDYQDGRYQITLDDYFGGEHLDAFQFTIRTPGYLSQESRRIQASEGKVTVDFALRPVQPVTGTVRDGDGAPVAGAMVFAFSAGEHAYLMNNEPTRQGPPNAANTENTAETDEDGSFSLRPSSETCTFLAVETGGYALERDYALDGESVGLILAPWARAELRAMLGDAPEAGLQIQLNALMPITGTRQNGRTPLQWGYGAETGDDGTVRIAQVIPGNYRVFKGGKLPTSTSIWCQISLEANTAVTLQLGGAGRPVTGSVAIPADLVEKIHWDNPMGLVRLSTQVPEPSLPEGNERWSEAEMLAWREVWMKTPAGQAYRSAIDRRVSFGTGLRDRQFFRIEDVPPGTYTLTVQLPEKPADQRHWSDTMLGTVTREVTVEAIEGDRSRAPMDLGELRLVD